MSEKITRRRFLQAGAAVLAAAALTACGGGGGSSVPVTPSTPEIPPESSQITEGDLVVNKDLSGYMMGQARKGSGSIFIAGVDWTMKATKDTILTADNFYATLTNEKVQFAGFFVLEDQGAEEKKNHIAKLTEQVTVAASDKWQTVVPCFEITQAQYNAGGNMSVTLKYNGQEINVSEMMVGVQKS